MNDDHLLVESTQIESLMETNFRVMISNSIKDVYLFWIYETWIPFYYVYLLLNMMILE
mgnify:CR=1 FL=1